jgi:hypothetical protein
MKDDGGGSAAVRNWPGRDSGDPYTSSAADTPESSRGAARSPSSTQGRWSGQSPPASHALKESFRRRWNRSTAPFDWGW